MTHRSIEELLAGFFGGLALPPIILVVSRNDGVERHPMPEGLRDALAALVESCPSIGIGGNFALDALDCGEDGGFFILSAITEDGEPIEVALDAGAFDVDKLATDVFNAVAASGAIQPGGDSHIKLRRFRGDFLTAHLCGDLVRH